MEKLLESLIESNIKWFKKGKVATYIPELRNADPREAGIVIANLNGDLYCSGKYETKFTIQSISKVVSLMLAISEKGQKFVFSKVGMEACDDSFNSIVNLEIKNKNKPLNPMINSGAIAVVSMICEDETLNNADKIIRFIRKLSQNPLINYNPKIYLSEKLTGHRNRSLAYFMKDSGVIDGDVENILDAYFKQCAIEVSCVDIANIGLVLANDGVIPTTGERVISQEEARIVKSIMITSGMYNASGEFAVNVGIPAKSGVGGGILACVPKRMGIGTYSPALDKRGNSVVGQKILEDLSKALELSIF